MGYKEFIEDIQEAVLNLKKIDKKNPIRIISHLDADGITSAAIILNALKRENYKIHLSIIKQLSDRVLDELKKEAYQNYVFTDLGTGQIESIRSYLAEKEILILDHHSFDSRVSLSGSVRLINPHMHGIDGSSAISGAGVTYLFCKEMNDKNKDMSHLAVIGAIGDVQEKDGFPHPTGEILDTAIKEGLIEVKTGLRWFGTETRSLVKLLTYGTELIIPGVTGNESNAVLFLNSLGINPKRGEDWTRYHDLSEDEQKRLVSAIVIKRNTEKNPEDIFGKKYLLAKEEQSTPFRDAKEFSTMLNACGRMDKPGIGVLACLGDKASKEEALKILEEYRQEIIGSLRWYDSNKGKDVTEKPGYIIINAKAAVRPTLIGTLASIISNSEDIKEGTLIISMAYDDDTIKVSLRCKGECNKNLSELVKNMLEGIKGEGGGHKDAAGAIIPIESEKQFISNAEKSISALSLS